MSRNGSICRNCDCKVLYCPPMYKFLKWNCWKFWSWEMKYHHSSVVESKSFHHSWLGFASSLVMKWFWFNSRLVMIFHFSTPEFSAIVHFSFAEISILAIINIIISSFVIPQCFEIFKKVQFLRIHTFGLKWWMNYKKNYQSDDGKKHFFYYCIYFLILVHCIVVGCVFEIAIWLYDTTRE